MGDQKKKKDNNWAIKLKKIDSLVTKKKKEDSYVNCDVVYPTSFLTLYSPCLGNEIHAPITDHHSLASEICEWHGGGSGMMGVPQAGEGTRVHVNPLFGGIF